MVAPPAPCSLRSSCPIPGADRRALTLEATTRTQESRNPPSGRERTPQGPCWGQTGRSRDTGHRWLEGAWKENPREGRETPKVTPKGQHGGADALGASHPAPKKPTPRYLKALPLGAATTVASAVAACLHHSSPKTSQETEETPPSSSSPAGRGPLLGLGCL